MGGGLSRDKLRLRFRWVNVENGAAHQSGFHVQCFPTIPSLNFSSMLNLTVPPMSSSVTLLPQIFAERAGDPANLISTRTYRPPFCTIVSVWVRSLISVILTPAITLSVSAPFCNVSLSNWLLYKVSSALL